MPIYEFVCVDCSAHFDKLTASDWKSADIKCPECSSENLERAVSSIGAIKGSTINLMPSEPPCEGCQDTACGFGQ